MQLFHKQIMKLITFHKLQTSKKINFWLKKYQPNQLILLVILITLNLICLFSINQMFASQIQPYNTRLFQVQQTQPMLCYYYPNNFYQPITSLANVRNPNTYSYGWVRQASPVDRYQLCVHDFQMVDQAIQYPQNATNTIDEQINSEMQIQTMNDMLAEPQDNILNLAIPQNLNSGALGQLQAMNEELPAQMCQQGLQFIIQQMMCQQDTNFSQTFNLDFQIANSSQAIWEVPVQINSQIIYESQEIVRILQRNQQSNNIMIGQVQEQNTKQSNSQNNTDSQKNVQFSVRQNPAQTTSQFLMKLQQEKKNSLLDQNRILINRNKTQNSTFTSNSYRISDADLRQYNNTQSLNKHFFGIYKQAQTCKELKFTIYLSFSTTNTLYTEADYEQIYKQIQQIQGKEGKQGQKLQKGQQGQEKKQQNKNVQPQQLPDLGKYQLYPSTEKLQKMSVTQLKKVNRVKISNKFGSIQFLEPISLYKKNFAKAIKIKQDKIQIDDPELKQKMARITYKNFFILKKTQGAKKRKLRKIKDQINQYGFHEINHCLSTRDLVFEMKSRL